MRLLLSEVARLLRFFAPLLQKLHPTSQRLRDRLQRFNTPVRSPVRPRKQPPHPRSDTSQSGAYQLSRERRERNLVHELSVPPAGRGDSHARGAYIIGQIRFPPPFVTTFVTTVLFGHTSTVDPSDVPSVFSSG